MQLWIFSYTLSKLLTCDKTTQSFKVRKRNCHFWLVVVILVNLQILIKYEYHCLLSHCKDKKRVLVRATWPDTGVLWKRSTTRSLCVSSTCSGQGMVWKAKQKIQIVTPGNNGVCRQLSTICFHRHLKWKFKKRNLIDQSLLSCHFLVDSPCPTASGLWLSHSVTLQSTQSISRQSCSNDT